MFQRQVHRLSVNKYAQLQVLLVRWHPKDYVNDFNENFNTSDARELRHRQSVACDQLTILTVTVDHISDPCQRSSHAGVGVMSRLGLARLLRSRNAPEHSGEVRRRRWWAQLADDGELSAPRLAQLDASLVDAANRL